MERIRMLIADDHPVFRYGLRTLLQAESAFCVGQAHPLKDHPISVAEMQEPPTVLLS